VSRALNERRPARLAVRRSAMTWAEWLAIASRV
jgi:hypothetical protein